MIEKIIQWIQKWWISILAAIIGILLIRFIPVNFVTWGSNPYVKNIPFILVVFLIIAIVTLVIYFDLKHKSSN